MLSRQYLFKNLNLEEQCSALQEPNRWSSCRQYRSQEQDSHRSHTASYAGEGHTGLRPPPSTDELLTTQVRFWLPVIWSKAGCGWQGRRWAHESRGLLAQSLRGRRHPRGRDARAMGGQFSQQSAAPHAPPTHSISSFSPKFTSRASRKSICIVWKDYQVALAKKYQRGRSLELGNEISCL